MVTGPRALIKEMKTTIVWLSRDLRVADNPALRDAAAAGAVVPAFIWSPEEEGRWAPGGASRWWLERSLTSLDASLRERGSRLFVRRGPVVKALKTLAKECGASAVAWNRRYEPAQTSLEWEASLALAEAGVSPEPKPGNVLFEPDAVRTLSGGPYRVFTPYWARCGTLDGPRPPAGDPGALRRPAKAPAAPAVGSLGLSKEAPWQRGLAAAFEPGEAAAARELAAFLDGPARDYERTRNLPASDGNSRLSPRLHFGELSVSRVWREALGSDPSLKGGFLGELGWRDFGRHALFHNPSTPDTPLDARFARFAWRKDKAGFDAWKRGETGYPLVDAGMRELRATGFMHNRVRMVVASFLTKDLLIDWREGAAWFWDNLVDADLASNTLNWQWAAGCGVDAAPFFRVFNPMEQARRFDPDGEYVRRWVPEAGTRDYPPPILDHKEARLRALDAFGAAGARR